VDPFTSEKKMHYGLDYVAEEGTPVIATATGTVTRIENNPVWGIVIEISFGYEYRAVYAHLGSYLVSKGRTVKRGQIIGTIGMSGLSTGPHLHYEVLREGVRINPQEILFPSELNSHS
jgi:murein DD-endopeptidase MepM/ murein hydrolase activator NlpD